MIVLAVDSGSLDQLHDLVLPPPVPLWPPAPAWYAVGALFVLVIGALSWSVLSAWFRNRYRRIGLSELDRIQTENSGRNSLSAIAEIVKRVALAAFPREQVAGLSGGAWLEFLDTTGQTNDFTTGEGRRLADTYMSGEKAPSPQLITIVRNWITHHRVNERC